MYCQSLHALYVKCIYYILCLKAILGYPGGGATSKKKLTGVCRPWYGNLYPIVGKILDKVIPYCRANLYKIFKIGHQNDIILSENAKFCPKTTNVAQNRIIFTLKSTIFARKPRHFENMIPYCRANFQSETLLQGIFQSKANVFGGTPLF